MVSDQYVEESGCLPPSKQMHVSLIEYSTSAPSVSVHEQRAGSEALGGGGGTGSLGDRSNSLQREYVKTSVGILTPDQNRDPGSCSDGDLRRRLCSSVPNT